MEARVFFELGVLVLGILCTSVCVGVPYDLFYSYGLKYGDAVLERTDDVSSNEIMLNAPVVFYDQRYNSLFVSSN